MEADLENTQDDSRPSFGEDKQLGWGVIRPLSQHRSIKQRGLYRRRRSEGLLRVH